MNIFIRSAQPSKSERSGCPILRGLIAKVDYRASSATFAAFLLALTAARMRKPRSRGQQIKLRRCMTSTPCSPSAFSSTTASSSSSQKTTSFPSSTAPSPSAAARAMNPPRRPASSTSTARPGAPAAPPPSPATLSTSSSPKKPPASRAPAAVRLHFAQLVVPERRRAHRLRRHARPSAAPGVQG